MKKKYQKPSMAEHKVEPTNLMLASRGDLFDWINCTFACKYWDSCLYRREGKRCHDKKY